MYVQAHIKGFLQAHGTLDTSETAQANVLMHLCCLLYLNTPKVRQIAPSQYRLTHELKLYRVEAEWLHISYFVMP